MTTRVMYVDGFNLFQANYHSNPGIDSNGEPVGGLLGTLLQIRGLINKFNPQKVLVVFDGPDAGLRRRTMYSEYKSKRRAKKRTTTFKIDDDESIQVDNETFQLERLFSVLKSLPVQMISIPFYEADDVIGYLAKKNPEYNNIIVSNDKDYLQMVTETTHVYQFTKKKLMTLSKIEEEFEIKPCNIIYYRSLIGDSSDELIGLKGIGPTTVEKISAFKEKSFNSFEEFWNEIEMLDAGKSKKLNLIKESKKNVLLMYQLMRLDETSLNQRAIEQLQSQLQLQLNKPYSSMTVKIFFIKNKLNFQIKNLEEWLNIFSKLKGKIEINS